MTEQKKNLHYKHLTETSEWIMGLAQKLKEGDKRLIHLIETSTNLTLASTDIILSYDEKLEMEADLAKVKHYYSYLVADVKIYKAEIKRLKKEIKELKLDNF